MLWLHLPQAWRPALFASLLRSASGFPFPFHIGTMPRRTAARRRTNVTRARPRSANSVNLRPTDCCVLSQLVSVRPSPHSSKRWPCLGRHQTPADPPPLRPPRSGFPDRPPPPPPPERHGRCSHISKSSGRNPGRRVGRDRRPGACSSPNGALDTTRHPTSLTIQLWPYHRPDTTASPAPWRLESYPSARRSLYLPVSLTASPKVSSLTLTTFFLTSWATPYVTPLSWYRHSRASPSADLLHAATNATSTISPPGWKPGQRTAAW